MSRTDRRGSRDPSPPEDGPVIRPETPGARAPAIPHDLPPQQAQPDDDPNWPASQGAGRGRPARRTEHHAPS